MSIKSVCSLCNKLFNNNMIGDMYNICHECFEHEYSLRAKHNYFNVGIGHGSIDSELKLENHEKVMLKTRIEKLTEQINLEIDGRNSLIGHIKKLEEKIKLQESELDKPQIFKKRKSSVFDPKANGNNGD